MKKYYKQLYAREFDKLDEMEQLFERSPKLTQENLNSPIPSK